REHTVLPVIIGAGSRSLVFAPMPPFRPCSVAIGRTCRAKREWIALTEPAVTRACGLALLKRIETAIGRASFVAVMRAPRSIGAGEAAGQEQSGKCDCSLRDRVHECLLSCLASPINH